MKWSLGETGLLGRDSIEMLVRCIRLERMDNAITVFRRRIKGVELEWLVAGIDDVVQRAAGNDDGIIGLDRVTGSVDQYFTLPCLETEELVVTSVDLLADILTWLQRHQHQLQMLAGVQDAAEIGVLFGQLFYIVNKAFHFFPVSVAMEHSLSIPAA